MHPTLLTTIRAVSTGPYSVKKLDNKILDEKVRREK
jgi:hypothetical protein